MKLSRLYANRPTAFSPITFGEGLNVVIAEIRTPENKKRDTHNLGKTTLGAIIDFTLLSRRDKDMFLFKYDQFADFVFFLEIRLSRGGYLTVRRSVAEASRISFKRHLDPRQDMLDLREEDWDHFNVPFERAQSLLDGYLDLVDLKPWNFRKGLGYLLRTQADYADVFQLHRYASQHSDWKPFIAHILGFDSARITECYRKEEALDGLKDTVATIEAQAGGSVSDVGKIDGMLSLKRKEIARTQEMLDSFDFRVEDKERVKQLVDQFDEQLATLNARRYTLRNSLKRISAAIDEGQILFDPDAAAELFEEAGVLFGDQLKVSFEQLIKFNISITEERRQYLLEDRAETQAELTQINSEINALGRRRSESLAFLTSTDSFEKYKELSDKLVEIRADALALDAQRAAIQQLQTLRAEIRATEAEIDALRIGIEENVELEGAPDSDGLFAAVRTNFDDIVRTVIDRDALISVSLNHNYHLEFGADILDEKGNPTSADEGTSYRKLLCVAFDLAVARAHNPMGYPQFVYHDGVFEGLDPRKKERLLDVIREYADAGIQQIITLIDSDTPPPETGGPAFEEGEIVLTLHDEGEAGRLFKMRAW
ncbi:DUF2326 domain-containing protein [Mycobacterium sp. CVI_P3]|uniref:DUF2326 domain-containing protein n=1 Tax=Mycobacterium pinniadriaticum TaxID=2994102 RepID=A0ABT3S8P8_9MYCO|nr:DUF2326 domain-containing protein [Mycobacterium pinniadriaticum]MCX2929449.1 DUF2326 domain-containing protein [Mycobacterium pinniadriaticum]MCX2935873.1 DUF2326 domain-containing protein [Mycobacterium pinniadriaticum]